MCWYQAYEPINKNVAFVAEHVEFYFYVQEFSK